MGFRNNLISAGILSLAVFATAQTTPKAPGEIAWAIRSEPKTFDPAKVNDQASETIRFLTGGVLLRVNRVTQQPEPDLAADYNISGNGRIILFHLRPGLKFSDGSDLTSKDAASSIRRVLAPATAAPVAEEFLSPQEVKVEAPDALTIRVTLARRVVAIARVFDEIAIEPADRPSETRVTSGPFLLAEYKRGQYVRLKRNPNYWRHGSDNAQLPYLSGVRLDIITNREQEISSFQRGDYDLIDNLPPEYFSVLVKRNPKAVRDLGPSINTEQMWFNESPSSPIPAYEKAWFTNNAFRVAISQAIHRADLARIAYDGHATPAYSFISPANAPWYNRALSYPHEDVAAANKLLAASGFHRSGKTLYDAENHPVKFSILTNAGNSARQKMATLIQQDLAAIGIEVTVATLDFPALLERLSHTQDYQVCLLGLGNVDPEPNAMMNVWLSSSADHQWNPSEKTPATPWEAEIDKQMQIQATSLNNSDRKQAIDRLQQIVADHQPFIYLVHPNKLYAISPQLTDVQPAILSPGIVWNIEAIRKQGSAR